MPEILSILKRIYTEDNALTKHLIWLMIALISMLFSSISSQDNNSSYITHGISLIISLTFYIYSLGYGCILMHNRFSEEGKIPKKQILPEFDILPFKVFWRYLPLMLTWLVFSIILAIPLIIPIFNIIYIFAYVFVIQFIIFVQVAYSEKFQTKGLYDIALLQKFLRLFAMDAIIWWFKIFILSLAVLALLILLILPLGIESILTMNNSFIIDIVIVFTGYFFYILSFINNYGMTEIYLRNWQD